MAVWDAADERMFKSMKITNYFIYRVTISPVCHNKTPDLSELYHCVVNINMQAIPDESLLEN